MISYGILAAAALYLLIKWCLYHVYKKRTKPLEQVDAALIHRINLGRGDSDA